MLTVPDSLFLHVNEGEEMLEKLKVALGRYLTTRRNRVTVPKAYSAAPHPMERNFFLDLIRSRWGTPRGCVRLRTNSDAVISIRKVQSAVQSL